MNIAGILIPAFYSAVMVTLIFIDVKKRIIPNLIIYPAIVITLALSWVWGIGIANCLLGGVIGLIAVGLPKWVLKAKIGYGDIKLGLLIGLMAGYPFIALTMLFTGVVGAVYAAVMLVCKKANKETMIPFAPFMATAAIITFWGGAYIWQALVMLRFS